MVKQKSKKPKLGQSSLRKQMGLRFKQFRDLIELTQVELGEEFSVYQSTITNIEVGKTFPGVKYLNYLGEVYGLNADWLVNGRGEQLHDPLAITPAVYNKYRELIDLLQVPVIEQLILARLEEVKVIAKEEIKAFLSPQSKIQPKTRTKKRSPKSS